VWKGGRIRAGGREGAVPSGREEDWMSVRARVAGKVAEEEMMVEMPPSTNDSTGDKVL